MTQLNFGAVLKLTYALCAINGIAQASLFVTTSGSANFAPAVAQYAETTGAFLGLFVQPGSGGLDNPVSLAFGPDRNLYVSSFGTRNILRYDGSTGAFLNAFVPSGRGGLGAPNGITFGPDGNLYVSDGFFGTNSVLRYDGKTGAFLDVFAGSGGLLVPNSLAFGPGGSLYVTSVLTNSILRYSALGRPQPSPGQSGAVFVANANENNGRLAFGPNGNLFVSSDASNDVKEYDPVTGVLIQTFITPGSGGLTTPSDLTFGRDGDLYVGDYFTGSVRRYNGSTGAFVNIFASPGSQDFGRVTSFAFSPVPEPASITLVFVGLTAFALGICRKQEWADRLPRMTCKFQVTPRSRTPCVSRKYRTD